MGDTTGQSYNEQILQSIIDGTPYENPNPYPSRIEQLLMELKEVIEQGGGGTVDQTYTPTSENAQSGKAVAEALETIPSVTVDHTFDPTSANPQSGAAVQEAISSDKYLLSNIYRLTGIVISSLAEPNQTGRYVTNCYYSVSKTNSESLPVGYYIGYTSNGLVSIYVSTSASSSTIHIRGFLTDYTSSQYTAGTTFNTNISDIRLIKVG